MEITIGVRNVARELTFETAGAADEVVATVTAALEKAKGAGGGVLDLEDNRGRRIIVPLDALGYVEIGSDEPRRVGFGTI
ncbi:conserved hypothetical protein [Beutenbergia cavernae DSM 12333]|uniref:ATP-binding protein n=1 Tax=Beutenbergia cavernae (strain ATCC BAA-8 / DSM 12333 / CCUG 43141 / JCM 11478 / NBRC 16432 / NCIMB 13614 / HKI 0122) TaxID=471853 RepID=C5BZ34_BEUC1|nr:DUF3107 domain-containing protein [Beutenbergia cavernae]ACQ81149.1 conserved hypothetical protein [Beutenbergia cavernae DSM 12333]